MRKSIAAITLPLLLAGCAVPTTVQRMGVGYNTAVANLTDQLALLNIVRAHHGYPLHYTSLTRLSGSMTFKGTAGIGSQFNLRGHDDTTTTTTAATNSLEVANEIKSAGHTLTPSIGGEVDSNPSFDVEVNDTKEFYQGILTAVEPGTIAGLIAQGYDAETLLDLTVIRFDFNLKKKIEGLDAEVGARLLSIYNDGGPDRPDDAHYAFNKQQLNMLLACYDFTVDDGKATDLAPVSRVAGPADKGSTISIKELALLDGDKLDLSDPIGATSANDSKVMIQRPGKRVGKFTWSGASNLCSGMVAQTVKDVPDPLHMPKNPPPDRVFVGHDKVMLLSGNDKIGWKVQLADAKLSVMFRSPEAIIQFVGDCLHDVGGGLLRCTFGDKTLFEMHPGRGGAGTVSADLGDHHYYVDPTNPGGLASLKTIGLIEKLIDLHKSSTDTPSTVPVHVVS